MPIQLAYDPALDAMVITAMGAITVTDLKELVRRLTDHPDFRNNINQLMDISQGTLMLSTQELKLVAHTFHAAEKLLGDHRKLAVVAPSDIDFGLSRMYESFFPAGPEVKIEVFRSLEKARDWLA